MVLSLSKLFFNVEECFCGCAVKDGSMIVATLELIFNSCAFGLSVFLSIYMLDVELCESPNQDDVWPRSFIIFILSSIIFFAGIVFAILGVLGLIKGNSQYVKLWIWHEVTNTFLILVLFSTSAAFVSVCNDHSTAIIVGLYILLYVVMKYVCTSLVHSHYLKMGVDTMQGYTLPTVTLKRPWSSDEEGTHQQLSEEDLEQ